MDSKEGGSDLRSEQQGAGKAEHAAPYQPWEPGLLLSEWELFKVAEQRSEVM